jgi:DNA helicase-2/ATP-dependent DNA helicase PcrA
LEQNYRSTKNIVEAANSVIENNKTKLEKEIWTANVEGAKIKVKLSVNEVNEGRFVADSIFENQMNHQLKNSDFAILYRTNAQSRALEDALREKNIDYIIYGGISFYQRKEIKDVVAYLRILVNPNDEEALKRIINYPVRGIGASTIDKLVVAANHYKKSVYEILTSLDQIDLSINSGIKTKLQNFVTMIQHFQIEAQTKNAFEVADFVIKQVRLIKDLEQDGTPEGISKVENVQEILNKAKNFTEEQKEKGEDDSLTTFLEIAALETSSDVAAKDDKPRVSLMTIHLAKGLEFPYVYIVGLEENLFPSAMSMNTRSELEEERRLFYVALTRAEQQAYLSYANTRYRWGQLVDCEPSRFLDEIDEKYIEHLAVKEVSSKQSKFIDETIFGSVPLHTIRFKKPIQRTPIKKEISPKIEFQAPKHLTKVTKNLANTVNLFDGNITVGTIVEHTKFGKGEVLSLEGSAANQKAEIRFETVGVKKLLLQFAKLRIIS